MGYTTRYSYSVPGYKSDTRPWRGPLHAPTARYPGTLGDKHMVSVCGIMCSQQTWRKSHGPTVAFGWPSWAAKRPEDVTCKHCLRASPPKIRKVRASVSLHLAYRGSLDVETDKAVRAIAREVGGVSEGSGFWLERSVRDLSFWFSTWERAVRFMQALQKRGSP